jgi:hypothetical protein
MAGPVRRKQRSALTGAMDFMRYHPIDVTGAALDLRLGRVRTSRRGQTIDIAGSCMSVTVVSCSFLSHRQRHCALAHLGLIEAQASSNPASGFGQAIAFDDEIV